MIKRLFLVISFLTILFLNPLVVSAQSITPSISPTITIGTTTLSVGTTDSTNFVQDIWNGFVRWLAGLWLKTNFPIASRLLSDVNLDMTSYGDLADSVSFEKKHSFAGSRSTDIITQDCLKGNVIKQTLLETVGYPNVDLARICFDTSEPCVVKSLDDKTPDCKIIKVNDLAHYFVQQNKPFYCDTNNKSINIDSNIIIKIQSIADYQTDIPTKELSCYQSIYNDFYISPKDNQDTNEENAKKMVKTPIPASLQDQNLNSKEMNDQVGILFIPNNYADKTNGLPGLFPNSWK